MSEEKEFKVIDKRHSAPLEEPAPKPPNVKSGQEGEGFVMKESPETESAPPSQIDFPTLIISLATGALIHLGVAPDPVSKKTVKNIELAKQNIDILQILREKTKGNLSKEEDQLLENVLAETQLRFVEAVRKP